MKYKGLDDKRIMQELCYAIIFRALLDFFRSRDLSLKRDAAIFIRSENCELMCYLIDLNYYFVLEIAGIEQVQIKEKRRHERKKRMKSKSSMSYQMKK